MPLTKVCECHRVYVTWLGAERCPVCTHVQSLGDRVWELYVASSYQTVPTRAADAPRRTLICPQCKGTFVAPGRLRWVYCSADCRDEAARERKRGRPRRRKKKGTCL